MQGWDWSAQLSSADRLCCGSAAQCCALLQALKATKHMCAFKANALHQLQGTARGLLLFF